VRRAAKLRIGYFAQHQIDALVAEDTPLGHLQSRRPNESQTTLRARLAGFGLRADQAETAVARLSGGQKARLSLCLATLDAPHLLILDEPTNHLDIESREALIEALNAYPGAVVLISHDMHLLSLVADRLWLVQDRAVTPWDDDLEAYRRFILSAEAPPPAPRRPPPARAAPPDLAALRAEVRRCEERVAKLEEMRGRLAALLADPRLYDPGRRADLDQANRKYAEVVAALDRAEALWLGAEQALEKAQAGND
jgi:ATP-binding cassette subfamily F protein 3